ncbi:hypothetical protein [Psychroserpens sp. NJDZ02]|uniref:hypothetical protein n=1 Tax=Psychroserpens sp. NJDZ02 TaxID=2570561 RepID=UPI0010A91A6C|nr:hypothetical protein [Psychroserpens sp. NJDZ02]QCE40687.1 hypothetical protein E9099_04380 [Psychroserpens sp. NJDZ02]
MIKIIYSTIFLLLFNSCASQESKKMEFINYDIHEPTPNYNYVSLTNNLLNTNLIDSLKVIGRPLTKKAVKFEVDTLRVNKLNVSLTKLSDKIKKYDLNKDRFEDMSIENQDGQEVPLGAILTLTRFIDYDKPKIFIPEPRYFLHKGEGAVKFEIFYKKNVEVELHKIIKEYTSKDRLEIEFIN